VQIRVKEKTLEIIFAVVFSTLILTLFFALLSMNDLIMGNDSAVHIERAEMFLESGRIPVGDIAWYPPLYHILLATFMAFTGSTSIEQTLVLVKLVEALINWLIIFSVYLIGAKFFSKKIGALASGLILLCLPLYEVNFWGGYTTLLSIAFIAMLILYLSLEKRDFTYILITFMLTFFLVLSHQLTAFLTFAILILFVIIRLIKSKGRLSKLWIAAIFGGAIAFFLYYFQAMLPHLNILISHIFFQWKGFLYQVPYVTPKAFAENFGFVLFLAFAGVVLSFFICKEKKKMSLYTLLALSFFIPLILSQSYLYGLYWSYQRFNYYLLPPLAIFAAVAFAFIIDIFTAFYRKSKIERKRLMKAVSVAIFLMMALTVIFRFQTVSSRINYSAYFYSTCDVDGYDAALWLKENFPDAAATVVTEKPGSWFGVYSGKSVIAETNPSIERNIVAESVLDLSCEIEHPLTLVRAYTAKGDVSDEIHVSLNDVWTRVSYVAKEGNFLSFNENGITHYSDLSSWNREVVLDEQSYPKKCIINYFKDNVLLTESILVQNDSYPITVVWSLSSLKSEITNATLYISHFFDLYFSFEKAYVPGSLDWENPWSKPSYAYGNEWAVVNFTRETLTGNYIGVYDEKNEAAFALKFVDLPEWGNLGVLASRQIDAIRFQYRFDTVNVNQTTLFTYQIVSFSKSSFSEMPTLNELGSMFDFKPSSTFDVTTRSYLDYIREKNVEFVVYDKSRFDSKLLYSNILQLVYSNDGYVVCRVKDKP